MTYQPLTGPTAEAGAELGRCAEWLLPAIEFMGGSYSFEDIAQAISGGDMQLWPGRGSAIVTQIYDAPKQKICTFVLAGGALDELSAMSQAVEAWAKEQGCTRIDLAGRRGWERSFLAGRGYQAKLVILMKEI